jgi:uncharacterized protein YcfJ
MNKSMVVGAVLGAAVATAGGAIAGYKLLDKGPEFAEVMNVAPIKEKIRTPREVCEDVAVTHQREVKDQNRVAGTVLGAVLGGVVGKQVGGGRGNKLATVAGAAAGGYAGNQVQQGMQNRDTYTTTEHRCHTVTDSQDVTRGYEVTYRLEEKIGTVRMDYDPGARIPVRDGQLVLNQAPVTQGNY